MHVSIRRSLWVAVVFLAVGRMAFAMGEEERELGSGSGRGRHCLAVDVPVTVPGVQSATIYGELCVPVGTQPTTVQLLVHSTWYNHKYFDPPQAAYSYVRSAVDSGYATFNIDRLGTGQSTKPPASLVTITSVEAHFTR